MTALRAAIAAEWTKLWTTRTVWWALLAAAVLMTAAAGQYALYADHGDLPADLLRHGRVPAGAIAVLATGLTQLAFAGLALLTMTGEYSTGTIRSTLAWVPSRGRLVAAKCAVVAAVTFVAGTLTALLGALVAIPLLDNAFLGGLPGDAVAIGGYLTLIAVLATGLATALRGPVVTLVVILLLVVLLPPILQTPDVPALNAVAAALPGEAGTHFLRGDTHPYPAATGLLILAAWATAATLTGWQALRHRDA